MRICFICNEYPPAPHGGIGTFVQNLARHLTALGQEVSVIGYDPRVARTTWEKENGITVFRLRSPFQKLRRPIWGRLTSYISFFGERLYLSLKLAELINSRQLDLVESYDWSGPLWSKPKIPLVVRLHGANTANQFYEHKKINRLLKFMERRNIFLADALAAVSRHIGELTSQALAFSKKYTVIYNGVDTESFRPVGVERNCQQIVFVGSLTRRKGIFSFLKAIPAVVRLVPRAEFTLVGPLPGGEEGRAKVQEFLSFIPTEMHANIKFAGFVPHAALPEVYSRAAVAVFPSFAEAFGLTCVEAMACEAAVVMTSRASGPELIKPGVSGLLADPGQPEEIATSVSRLLQNPAWRQELGQQARQQAVAKFDSRMIAVENYEFYQQAVKS